MAKKLCELCGKEYASDIWFGVHMCSSCGDEYAKAKDGDASAIARFIHPNTYPNATDNARKNLIAIVSYKAEQMGIDSQEIDPDESEECLDATDTINLDAETRRAQAKQAKKFIDISGLVVGFVAILLGACVHGMKTGSFESSYQYGGDAYTGIQNAAAQNANNIKYLAEIVKTGMTFGLCVFGVALMLYFFRKLLQDIENK